MSKIAVVTFMRANPPTKGHALVFEEMSRFSKNADAEMRIYLSQTQDSKRNPLKWEEKIAFLKESCPEIAEHIVEDENVRSIFDVMKTLEQDGITEAYVIVGEDRVDWFEKILNEYNTKEYNIETIRVACCGGRDPDSDGVDGISSSKMRKFIIENDYKSFKSYLPGNLSEDLSSRIFRATGAGMLIEGCDDISDEDQFMEELEKFIEEMDDSEVEEYIEESERQEILREDEELRSLYLSDLMLLEEETVEDSILNESITKQERVKRSLRMKRLSKIINRKAQIAKKRLPSSEQLQKRAKKAAIGMVKMRIAKKPVSELSPGEKDRVEAILKKRSGAVKRLVRQLIPKLRNVAKQRIISQRGQQ